MYGSDIDTHSLDHAQRNVDANNLSSRIKLRLSSPEDPLIPLDKLGVSRLDFVMCNPPFYSSEEDMARAYGIKEMPPSAVCWLNQRDDLLRRRRRLRLTDSRRKPDPARASAVVLVDARPASESAAAGSETARARRDEFRCDEFESWA
jgi:23S rRNA A1618 N6-methylase RlmF